eukprot:28320-Amphidinium_carterae.1
MPRESHDKIPPLAHMPREKSPARMRALDRTPIPLAHMPREWQCNHPQVWTFTSDQRQRG